MPRSFLWLAGWVLLAAGYASARDGTSRLAANGRGSLNSPLCSDDEVSGGLRCPHRNKSVTLVPSFTKTTPTATPPVTTRHPATNHTTPRPATTHATNRTTLHKLTTVSPQKHTTSHRHHHHTTSAHHKDHTTQHRHSPTTSHQPRPTTSHHHNPTTSHQPRPTTSHHHNLTTSHQPRPTTSHHHNLTTSHQPRPTTSHHHNATTSHQPRPTTSPHHNTTAHSVLTTSHRVTVAPPPTLIPFVLVWDYKIGNKTDTCLRAQMGLRLRIRYSGKTKQQVWGEFALQPNRTNVTGACHDTNATLNLRFPEGFLIFFFTKNKTQNTYYLSRVTANLTHQFPQATETSFGADNASLHEFQAHLGHSYQCRNRSLALAEGFRLNVLRERIQVFGLPGGEFGEAEVCPEQRRSNALPIAVGVVLGLLILIVVVAFFVGRWRRPSGYQSL